MSETWDGRPESPERDGWHWLHHPEDLRPMVTPWNAELQGWPSGALHSPQGVVDLGFRYLGPCLTPAEVAAALAQAERRGMDRALDAAKKAWREFDSRGYSDPDYAQGRADGREDAIDTIRAAMGGGE